MNKLLNVLFFVAGAGLGAACMYKYAETKAYQQAQEEINAMKKYYKEKYETANENETFDDVAEDTNDVNTLGEDTSVSNYEDYPEPDEQEMDNYRNTLQNLNYGKPEKVNYTVYAEKPDLNELASKYQDENDIVEEPIMREDDAPYIITDEEDFGNNGYEVIVLELYTYDEVLVDSGNDDRVEDVDSAVGWDNIHEFLDSENTSMYVRNDAREVDFEILKVDESYNATHQIR